MRYDREIHATQNSKTSGRGFESSRSCQILGAKRASELPEALLLLQFADIEFLIHF